MAAKDKVKELMLSVRQNAIGAAEKATLTFEMLVRDLRTAGMSDIQIRTRLLNDFVDANPRFFGQFKNEVRDLITSAQGRAYQQGVVEDVAGTGVMMRWTTESDENVCDDCEARAGDVRSMLEWEAIGLPKSGFSVCGTNCRCELTEETLGAPDTLAGGIHG